MAPLPDSENKSAKSTMERKWLWMTFVILLWTALFAWLWALFWNRPNGMDRYFALHIGDRISYRENSKIIFENWGGEEIQFNYRWTTGKKASISFRLAQVDKNRTCRLTVKGMSLGTQEIGLFLNKYYLGKMTFPGSDTEQSLSFKSSLLTTNALNVLALDIPEARQPGKEDTRMLGLALQSLVFEYSDK